MSSKLAASAPRRQVLGIYRELLHEASKFASYNFREYALRRTRDAFHEHKQEHDPQVIKTLIDEARRNLAIVRRQAIISQMYRRNPSILEHLKDQEKLQEQSDRSERSNQA